jgi:hypothetical protein
VETAGVVGAETTGSTGFVITAESETTATGFDSGTIFSATEGFTGGGFVIVFSGTIF